MIGRRLTFDFKTWLSDTFIYCDNIKPTQAKDKFLYRNQLIAQNKSVEKI